MGPVDKKILRDTLLGNGEEFGRPPVWLMRQAGRYLPEYRAVRQRQKDFIGFCLHADDAAEVTLQPIRRYDMDAAIIFSDILMVPYALGQKVWFETGEGPRLDALDPHNRLAEIDAVMPLDRLSPVYEAIGKVCNELPKEKSLIGFAGAPWTLACYMIEGKTARDYAKARIAMLQHGEWFAQLIDRLTDAVTDHLEAQVKAGADVLMIFDSWAGVLDHVGFERFSIAPARAIVERLKQRCPGVPVIAFPKGSGMGAYRYAQTVGVQAIGADAQLNAMEMASLQSIAVTQGNVDNLRLAHDIQGALKQLNDLLHTRRPGRLIVNLGHGVIPETPPEHVAQLIQAVKQA